jgi:hypothetical protein
LVIETAIRTVDGCSVVESLADTALAVPAQTLVVEAAVGAIDSRSRGLLWLGVVADAILAVSIAALTIKPAIGAIDSPMGRVLADTILAVVALALEIKSTVRTVDGLPSNMRCRVANASQGDGQGDDAEVLHD